MSTSEEEDPDADVKRLFHSLLSTYLLAIGYNRWLATSSPTIKHCFHLISGLGIAYYNFGFQAIHSLVTCLTVWLSIHVLGPGHISMLVANFIFCMTYLMYGYYEKESSQTGHFTWTLPQCVLTLSLIAISFDIYDGHRGHRRRSQSRKLIIGDNQDDDQDDDRILDRVPTLLQLLAKVYFPATFLIGPQVQFKHYLQFVESKQDYVGSCWMAAIVRFATGLLFTAIYQWGQTHWPLSYLLTEDFNSRSLFMKMTLIMLVTKLTIYKYISGWLIAEGACIMYGISRDPNSKLYSRCCNVCILHYETTPTFRGLIESFNMSTNRFAMEYVYKRLKFLGSKLASHCLTLAFLAAWHGFASGYYMSFAMELFAMKMETDIAAKVIAYRTKHPRFNEILNRTWFRWLIYALMRLHVLYMLGYCFVPFALLDHRKWVPVLAQVYFVGHFIYITWFVVSLAIRGR